MIPAWGTVLVAICASAVGGFAGAVLRSRYERAEAVRQRMLLAADDLITELGQALMRTDELNIRAERAMSEPHVSLESVSAVVKEARRCVDEAQARFSRVELLFGTNSAASDGARRAIRALRVIVAEYDNWPPGDSVGARSAWDGYAAFSEEARMAIENYGSVTPRWLPWR
jgi:hypothetical protein